MIGEQMRKELLIKEPLISCYPQHAFYLSIISSNKNCLPWIFSNYSNLFIDQKGFCDFFVKTPEYYLYPWFQGSQRIHRDLLEENNINFIDFIKRSINKENYIWLHLNEFYLPCSTKYKKLQFIHSALISGYDDKEEKFFVNGFYNNRKYSKYLVSYKDIEKSFKHAHPIEDFKFYIHLLKYNCEYDLKEFKYNKKLFKHQLIAHLSSTIEPFLNLEEAFDLKNFEDLTTGLEVYKKIEQLYLYNTTDSDYIYDLRPFYVIYEHKKLLNLKLDFLKNKQEFILTDEIYKQLEVLEKESIKVLNLYIKYGLTKDKRIIVRIRDGLNTMREMEKEVLEEIVERLVT